MPGPGYIFGEKLMEAAMQKTDREKDEEEREWRSLFHKRNSLVQLVSNTPKHLRHVECGRYAANIILDHITNFWGGKPFITSSIDVSPLPRGNKEALNELKRRISKVEFYRSSDKDMVMNAIKSAEKCKTS